MLLQQGSAATAIEKIEYKLLKPLEEADHAELLGALKEVREELEYVDDKYVRISDSDVKAKDDKLLKDIFNFFGVQGLA